MSMTAGYSEVKKKPIPQKRHYRKRKLYCKHYFL